MGELAQEAGVSAPTVRFYERAGCWRRRAALGHLRCQAMSFTLIANVIALAVIAALARPLLARQAAHAPAWPAARQA